MVKFSEWYAELEDNGFVRVKKKGAKHAKYVNPTTGKWLPVGRHPSKEIPTGTYKAMRKQAGLQ